MKYLVQLALLIICGIAVAGGAHAQTWYDSNWDKRIPFSAVPDSLEGGGPFADFTLLLQLDATNFSSVFAHADSTGQDLVVTAGDGATVLDHELVHYDPVAQTGELWFRVPSLSSVDNEFFLYYENELATATPTTAWTADHLAVYHFGEDPSLGTLKDWGPNGGDAVAAVAPSPTGPGWQTSDRVAGQIGDGWQLDGADLWIYTTNVTSTDTSFTISAWFSNSQLIDAGAAAFTGPLGAWNLSFQRTGGEYHAGCETQNGDVSWGPDVLDDEMHLYTWTLDAVTDSVTFYFDGVPQGYQFYFVPVLPLWGGETIGGQIGIASPWAWNPLDVSDGIVDEFRIVQGTRSPEWVMTEYRNAADPSTFYVVEAAEQRPTATGPWTGNSLFGKMTVSPNPFRAVAWIDVETTRSDVTVQVYDARGRLVRTLPTPREAGSGFLRYLWDGRDGQGTQVSNGIYYVRALSAGKSVSGKALLVR